MVIGKTIVAFWAVDLAVVAVRLAEVASAAQLILLPLRSCRRHWFVNDSRHTMKFSVNNLLLTKMGCIIALQGI